MATQPDRQQALRIGLGLAVACALAFVASVVPQVRQIDSYWYTGLATQPIIHGCPSIACFRVLVPWVLGLLPGVELKWRVYSVVFNALAGVAVFDLSLRFGLSRRASIIAMTLSAFGSQSLWTLFEPFNADPLMFFLAPLVTRWLLEERIAIAFAVAAAGVLAKEFVVAPLAIVAIADAHAGRRRQALRIAGAAAGAFVIWVALHVSLIHWFGYNYSGGGNASTRIFSGGYLWFWLTHQPLRASLAAQFVEFGAVYFLLPVGFLKAPRRLKALAIASLPIAAVFCYVEQPDRALWNFHFLISPLAALALEPLATPVAAAFVALYAMANLRVGAQIPFVPEARYTLAASTAIALLAIVAGRRVVAFPHPGGTGTDAVV